MPADESRETKFADPRIWVVALSDDDDARGRVADARDLAERLGVDVAVLLFAACSADASADALAANWIAVGADHVEIARLGNHLERVPPQANYAAAAMESTLAAAAALWGQRPPRLILAGADPAGRAWSARLAARCQWQLVSPALIVRLRDGVFVATAINGSASKARSVPLAAEAPAIVALRPGVCQPLAADASRRGTVQAFAAPQRPERSRVTSHVAADPAHAEIQHLSRLVAGGRGVGGRDGFHRLRAVARQLQAGVAASRMAVDLGWIEYARQVGQTGKTVRPDLYLACGISGAGHHLQGMSQSRCIVAINSDPQAPIMAAAHLAIAADLHAVLAELERLLPKAAAAGKSERGA